MSNVLICSHEEADYGFYMMYDGLCCVLGDKHVVTYPFNKTYYGMVADDYLQDNGQPGYTAPTECMIPRDPMDMNLSIYDVVANLLSKKFDLIVFGPRSHSVKALRDIIDRVERKKLPPVVFAEFEDYDTLRQDWMTEFKPDVCFKRETLTSNFQTYSKQRIYPMPFSAVLGPYTDLPDCPKDIDIFFACGNTFDLREKVLVEVKRLAEKHQWNFVGGGNEFRLNYADYHKHIRRAKIGISVRGWGRDTVRYWEIPSHPTLLVAGKFDLAIPDPFTHNETAAFFKEDLSDLEDILYTYLTDDVYRTHVAKCGHEHLKKHHTTEARARYMLEAIRLTTGVAVC